MSSAVAAEHHPPPDIPELRNPMKGPLTKSVLFHIVIVTLCIVGIPYLHRDLPELSEPLSVELVKPDELAQAVKPAHAPLRQPPKQVEKPPPLPPQPQPPQVNTETPPKPVEPEKPPEPVKDTPLVKPPDELAPPVKKPPKAVKPPDKKPPVKEKTADQQQAFNSVLKNLIAPKNPGQREDNPDKAEKSSPHAKPAPEMTSNEFAALQRQLSQCWSMIAGARMAENLAVDVKLYMNPDRTVQSKMVVDQFRYFSDGYFRAAADSALRAVEDPHCNPLDLPPDKYEVWKVITVTFDPKQML
jgi:hypothetical protein